MRKNFYSFICFVAIMACCACSSDEGSLDNEAPVLSGENSILSLQLRSNLNRGVISQDYEATIDGTDISIFIPLVTQLKELVVTFTLSGGTVTVDGVKQESGVTKNDFSQPRTYVVTAENGEKQSYTVDIHNTRLPIVYIQTPDGKAITSKEEWMENTTLRIVQPDGTQDLFTETASIRGRGNSTWNYPKKPYAIKLSEKQPVLGMPKHKRWVLLANWMDRTLIRNHVAFEVARRTSMAWTPNGQFVEVVLNGRHDGNYYLCEQIRVDKNRVNVSELKSDDTSDEAITGGYLMELDVNYDEVNKFKSAHFGLPYQFKSPDEDVLNSQQMQYMQDYVAKLESLLKDENELAKSSYMGLIDVTSFIDFWLIQEVVGNGEPNHPKSCYMHKERGGLLTAGPVWDFDYGTYRSTTSGTFRCSKSIYYGQLFKDPQFVAKLKERWAVLYPKFQSIPEYIDAESAKLKLSDQLNSKLWPIDRVVNLDESFTYEEAIRSMKECFNTKLQYMDQKIKAM